MKFIYTQRNSYLSNIVYIFHLHVSWNVIVIHLLKEIDIQLLSTIWLSWWKTVMEKCTLASKSTACFVRSSYLRFICLLSTLFFFCHGKQHQILFLKHLKNTSRLYKIIFQFVHIETSYMALSGLNGSYIQSWERELDVSFCTMMTLLC